MFVFVVAERLALRGTYDVHLDSAVEVEVGPSYDYELQKFQVTFRLTD